MSRLTKNILYNLMGQSLGLLLGFIAVKYVFTQLGEDALGIIYFSLTLNTVLYSVLEMGISSTLVREVSAHFNDQTGYTRELIRTASLFYWGAYLLLAVAIYLAAPVLVEKWVTLKTMDIATATRMVQILGIGLLTTLPCSLYGSLLRGLQRMEFNNVIDVTMIGLQQLGIIVILALGGELFDVVYWLTGSVALTLLGYLLVSARFFPFGALVPGYSSAVVRRNFRYSLNMAAITLLATVHTRADKAMVSKFSPIGTFGFYGYAATVVSKSALVTSAISQAAFPSLSGLFSSGDRGGLMAQYRKLQDLACFANVLIIAAIPFATLPLFSYLLNAEAAQMLLLPVTLLCVGTYMNSTAHIPYFFSLAAGRPDIAVRLNFYALFVVLPVTVLLVYFLGLAGAGMSWIFYHLFAYAYAIPRICSECLRIPVSEWYSHVLKIFALAGLTYGTAWIVLHTGGHESLLLLALGYVGASIGFLVGAYLLMVDELRGTVHSLLQTVRVRLAEVL